MFKYRAPFVISVLALALTAVQAAPDGRIVGGRQVSITKHPHQVSLRFRSCNVCAYTHSCGGSLLTDNIVLCAAHCVNNREAKNMLIVAGSDTRNGGDGYVSRIEKFIMHEQYNPSTTDNDVALLFLQTPLPLDGVYMAPIGLASEVPPPGTKAMITGFGTTSEGGAAAPKLMEVDVPIVNNTVCSDAYGEGRITASMLCAGATEGGKDSCQGDSGGPLVANGKVVGIVSWGRGCARPGFPGVYSNVPYLKPWIEENMADKTIFYFM